jgi:hypothetical protein
MSVKKSLLLLLLLLVCWHRERRRSERREESMGGSINYGIRTTTEEKGEAERASTGCRNNNKQKVWGIIEWKVLEREREDEARDDRENCLKGDWFCVELFVKVFLKGNGSQQQQLQSDPFEWLSDLSY